MVKTVVNGGHKNGTPMSKFCFKAQCGTTVFLRETHLMCKTVFKCLWSIYYVNKRLSKTIYISFLKFLFILLLPHIIKCKLSVTSFFTFFFS